MPSSGLGGERQCWSAAGTSPPPPQDWLQFLHGILYSYSVAPHLEQFPSTAPLTDVRNNLSEIVDEIDRTGSQCVITKHGRPVAVILSSDEYESLVETMNILSDQDTMAAIAQGEAEFAAGEFVRLDEI